MNSVLGELVSSMSNLGSVEIKQEMIEDFNRSQAVQPIQDDEIKIEPEDNGYTTQWRTIASACQNMPIVSNAGSPSKVSVRPIVHRQTGKISIENYCRRRNALGKHPLPSTLIRVPTVAEQNAVRTLQANMISPVALDDESDEAQSINTATTPTEQGDYDEDEIPNDALNDSESSQPMEIYGDYDIGTSSIDAMEVTEAHQQPLKKPHYIVALKSSAVKASSYILLIDGQQKVLPPHSFSRPLPPQRLPSPVEPNADKIPDHDMDDAAAVHEQATNQPVTSPKAANPQVQQGNQQNNATPAPAQNAAQNRSFCRVCQQQYSSVNSLRKHENTIKHNENVQKQQQQQQQNVL